MFCLSLIFVLISIISQGTSTSELQSSDSHVTINVVAVLGGIFGCVLVVVICVYGRNLVNPSVMMRGPPSWTNSLVFRDDMNEGFTGVSDGMSNLTPFQVIRERLGINVTDAARWSGGMTEGKHVFEVYWPASHNRGISSCIGVGTADVPLRKQGRVSLVGAHSGSWGLDLSKRRTLHADKMIQRLSSAIPDRFFMYADMDSGKIAFGGDLHSYGRDAEFYGDIIHGIPKNPNKPKYLMVSCCKPRETIKVYYRGTAVQQGGYDLCMYLLSLHQPIHMSQQVYVVPTAPYDTTICSPTSLARQEEDVATSSGKREPPTPETPPPPYPGDVTPATYFPPNKLERY